MAAKLSKKNTAVCLVFGILFFLMVSYLTLRFNFLFLFFLLTNIQKSYLLARYLLSRPYEGLLI